MITRDTFIFQDLRNFECRWFYHKRFFGKHGVLAAQTGSLWYKSASCVSPIFYIFVLLVSAQIVFAQSPSEDFSYFTHTPGELIVRLHSDASRETFEALSRKLGARSVSPIFSPATPAGQHPSLRRSYLVRFPVEWELEPLRRRYANHSTVEAVEVNRLNRPCAAVPPNDPNYGEQWNLSLINMPEAWRIEQGNLEVTVAVVDGGIDTRHPEFRSQLWQNVDEIPGNGVDDDANGYVDDIKGWDFSDAPTLPGSGDWTVRDNEPEDEIGHGTHVSGIIAAAANNGIGIAGIAWGCRLMPLRAGFKYGGGGYLQNDDVAAAIVYAADNGAQVINMSWGDTVNAFIIEDAIAYADARGCILIAAAGNDGAVGSLYPAGLGTVISVAALETERQLSGISNFGATIDIAAPGDEILSTDLNGGFQHLSGTSMAAAHVSGVAALVVSAHPNYTNTEVRDVLIVTAGQLFVSPLVGAGSLDAYAALTAPMELTAKIDTVRMPTQTAESERLGKIEIFGSAGGVGFSAYSLEYGIGEVPDLWFPLGTSQTRPQLNACLYKWETSALTEGRYTIRLSVTSKNGETKRDRTVVDVRHAAPLISKHASQTWFAGERIASVVMWETDEIATGRIDIFRADGEIVSTAYSDSENLLHIVNVSELGIPPGAYMYRLSVENRAGFHRIDDNNGMLYDIEVEDTRIDPLHLSRAASAELGLHAVSTAVDLNRNGKLELVTAEIGTNVAQIFEITDDGTFSQVFSFSEPFLPRAIADTDNDGRMEILCNPPEVTFLLEQSAQGEFPTERIWEVRGNWGRTVVDVDADGVAEILARDNTANAIHVYEADGDNSYRNIATLENPTLGNNRLSANLATGDFDGDGRIEILAADDDGDVFIFEAAGDDRYSQTWTARLDEGEPELFASGDMDGDGKDEFAICAKTGTEIGTIGLDIRYNHWLLTVFAAEGDDRYRPVWTQRIRDVQDGGNGMTIADADNDGRSELCIAVAPHFYLVRHDGIDYRPIWYHAATNTLNPIVADLNGDGENALLFNSDNVLTVFTTSTGSNGRSENPQPPIATRRPRLSDAVYSPPNQLSLVFDKPIGVSAMDAGRYRLHKYGNTDSEPEIHTPRSAILDRSGQRVLLTFPIAVFRTGTHYQIEVGQVSDMDGAELADDARLLTITLPAPQLAGSIVYPNPAACNQVTFDKLPIGTHIDIYDVSGKCIASFAKTERERDRKVWDLSGISSGIYIYVLSSETDRRVGKLSVVR